MKVKFKQSLIKLIINMSSLKPNRNEEVEADDQIKNSGFGRNTTTHKIIKKGTQIGYKKLYDCR